MLTIILVILNLLITSLVVYLFDYKGDEAINSILVIILSVVVSPIITAIIAWISIEFCYLILPKYHKKRSMLVHKIGKQYANVPFYLSLRRLEVIGKEHLPKEGGFTIYSNHVSWIDPTLIMNALYDYPVVGLGKEDSFKIPIIGKFAPKFGFVMIQRENLRQSAIAIKTVVNRVQEGHAVFIFPEGTRNRVPNTVLDFKAGAFKAAVRSSKPIVPIALIKSNRRKYGIFKTTYVVIHKPIEFLSFKDSTTQDLSRNVRQIIKESVNKYNN